MKGLLEIKGTRREGRGGFLSVGFTYCYNWIRTLIKFQRIENEVLKDA